VDLGLSGKKAVVTGGSRGIGLAIARELAREGVDVAICARGAEAVSAATEELRELGVDALGAAVDVSDREAYVAWIDSAAASLGGLDIFVANASALALEIGEGAWRKSYDVDLMHTVRGCEAARPHLQASVGGAIVIVSSVSAVMAALPPTQRAYGPLKAALVAYGAQLAQELAPSGIRVNVVSPGAVLFPGGLWDGVRRTDPDGYARVVATSALGRLGAPEEIARAAVFLASPAASFVTGANLRVDGGALKHADF
jgi:NAD(P)-dependent dehydrogenase (short-subunit alcohol dehydrogenase family)